MIRINKKTLQDIRKQQAAIAGKMANERAMKAAEIARKLANDRAMEAASMAAKDAFDETFKEVFDEMYEKGIAYRMRIWKHEQQISASGKK